MDMLSSVGSGEHVLLVWAELGSGADTMQQLVTSLQQQVGQHGRVAVENAERLTISNHKKSSFTQIFSNMVGIPSWRHETEYLGQLLSILAPNGTLQLVESGADVSSLRSRLILAGFTNVGEPEEIGLPHLTEEEKARLVPHKILKIQARKPAFEVGASQPLSFAKKAEAPKASVWTLEDLEDESVELIDETTLLEEADLVKPDPASLRVCGTTGKRKACKDCSCGLREELEAGTKVTTKSVTSSCGSCYLGDAFRCASCPYLGMPAFKPGEKIQLSDRQLNPDVNPQ